MSEELGASFVVRLRDGVPEAAQLLEQHFRAPLLRFARSYLPADRAEDALQDVFVKVLAARQVPDSFRAWIYRLARNHFSNLRRSRRHTASLPEGFDPPATLHGELTRLGKRERNERLVEALSALSEEEREAVLLRYGEGLSRQEIAEVLTLEVGQVKTRLFEGMRRLRRHADSLE